MPEALRNGRELRLEKRKEGTELVVRHELSERQVEAVLKGGLVNRMRERLKERESSGER